MCPQHQPPPTIRQANAADIPAILAIAEASTTAALWSVEHYARIFESASPRRVALLIEFEATVRGFLIAKQLNREWEIENVAISQTHHGRGFGSQLLQGFITLANSENAQSVFLEVRESNSAARALYQKCNFVEVARRPDYYGNPSQNAIVYRLLLQ